LVAFLLREEWLLVGDTIAEGLLVGETSAEGL
jgi:hypothetical protein